MKAMARALRDFFGGFGLPAWREDAVPDGARRPYITYQVACPPPLGGAPLRARVWYPEGRGEAAFDKCREIMDALEGGAALRRDDGIALLALGETRNIEANCIELALTLRR